MNYIYACLSATRQATILLERRVMLYFEGEAAAEIAGYYYHAIF